MGEGWGKRIEPAILKTSDPGLLTETAMANLLAWHNDTRPSFPWTLAVASEFVSRFLACHPFQYGNGRIGRFLMNVMLASGGYPWTVIPLDSRDDYLASLEAASVDQDIVPFAQFLANLVKHEMEGNTVAKLPESKD